MAAVPPPVGFVTVASEDPPITVTARLNDERPTVEQGYGGWDESERPRKQPITTFKGSPGLHLSLPLLVDNWTAGTSIEPILRRIARLGEASSTDGEPPQLQVVAAGGAVPYTDRTWVVQSLDWGDALMNDSGNRVRQAVTLSLIEYVEDVYLTERSAAKRRRKKAAKKKRGATHKRVTAKASKHGRGGKTRAVSAGAFGSGEDLLTIAARELGDADRWVEIAKLNGLRDPRAIEPGQELRMP